MLAVLWECADTSTRAFVSGDILWQAGEKPSAMTRAFSLLFKRRGDPCDPAELKWRPLPILAP